MKSSLILFLFVISAAVPSVHSQTKYIKFKKYLIPIPTSSDLRVTGSYWSDVEYWGLVNNGVKIYRFDGSRKSNSVSNIDTYLLDELKRNNGYLSTPVKDINGKVAFYNPDTVSVWGYLAELGLAIINNGDDATAKRFLDTTRYTAEFYENALFEVTAEAPTQGRLINRASIIPQLVEDADLPFNMNAAFAYFCAVRNALSRKTFGAELSREKQLATKIYLYLRSKTFSVVNPLVEESKTESVKEYVPGTNLKQPSHLVAWKYNNEIRNDTDDVSHAGFAARSLAFGASEGFVERSTVHDLFTYTAPMAKTYNRQFMNMDARFDIYPHTKLGLYFWDLPYSP